MGDLITRLFERVSFDPFPELDDIDPVPDTFSTDAPIEDDEIPLHDAVETCHRVAQKIEAIG